MPKIFNIRLGTCAVTIPMLDTETEADAVERALCSLEEHADRLEASEEARLRSIAPKIANYLDSMKPRNP